MISTMFTVVGLGNIGEAYHETRHNVGWSAVEYFMLVHAFPDARSSSMLGGAISRGMVQEKEVQTLFPHTFMNNSGFPVKKTLPEPHDLSKLIVVHDDIALPWGEVRIGVARGSGGHNGVQSIIDALGSNAFIRVRIGIGEKNIFGTLKHFEGEKLSRYVLGTLKYKERTVFEEGKKVVVEILDTIISHGADKAMQTFNGRAIEV